MSSKDISFAPPRGMRDFYPDDMVLRDFIFGKWRESALKYGFSPYDACVVESMELLRRKAGEEISEQIYTFKDKSDRELALRPEMTPTLARMLCAKYGSISFPIKWSTIAQCFRYERMTRGRKREHYQLNLDIIGDESLAAEAETIACAVDAITSMGIKRTDIKVFYSNRRLLSDLLAKYNIPDDQHSSVFLALDKKGKIPDEKIHELLLENGVTQDTLARIDDLNSTTSLEDLHSIVPDSAGYRETLEFMKMADAFGIADVLVFDLSVIRGLAYYTGIVFEAFDAERKLRALFGGGRYDNLLSTIGGKDTTAVGMGFGDVVIGELMSDLGVLPQPSSEPGIGIGFMAEEQRMTAIQLATALRASGRNVSLAAKKQKPKAFFKAVSEDHTCGEAIYVGPDDVGRGTVKIKNLATREEKLLTIAEIVS